MTYVLITHQVHDYHQWKAVFDEAAGLRRDAGESDYTVFRYVEDGNRVVHLSRWTSVADARKFFESQELVEIRARAGVRAPEFVYLEELASGAL
jgi:heme-degrading monooxygenase HmoA